LDGNHAESSLIESEGFQRELLIERRWTLTNNDAAQANVFVSKERFGVRVIGEEAFLVFLVFGVFDLFDLSLLTGLLQFDGCLWAGKRIPSLMSFSFIH
jgi:hypothetical protein